MFSVIFCVWCHMFSSLLNCCLVVNGSFVFLGLVSCQGQSCLSPADCQGRLGIMARLMAQLNKAERALSLSLSLSLFLLLL